MCPRAKDDNRVQISCDGVKECKSTSVSLDVYSTKHVNCKYVFPHRIIRPLGRYRAIDNQEQLNRLINDVLDNGKNISSFVGDNPKRAFARYALGHASYYPCEYCFARGVATCITNVSTDVRKKELSVQIKLINDKLSTDLNEDEKEELRKLKESLEKKNKEEAKRNHTKITWPASTAGAESRTREKIINIVENLNDLSPEEKKGIVGRSLLLDIPNFDIVRDNSAEYLHSVCLGLIKRLVELTFAVGEVRPRKTNRPLCKPTLFNKLMALIKTPKEFPRRARDLDFSVFKGVEFRNLALFYFPLIIDCIEEGHGERELWLYLAFMIRSCVIPSHEFRYVSLEVVELCCTKFYALYERLFGLTNCTYNTHVVCSHLPEIRAAGPLTETSAFVFESFYGEMKNSFVPGTISPLKQLFQNILLKRVLSTHCCEIPITYCNYETSLENNTLIYVWEHNCHKMYVIKEVDQENLICHTLEKENYEFEDIETIRLDWNTVGVYQKVGVIEEDVIIRKEQVSGKVIAVKNLLITCPNNVLREK